MRIVEGYAFYATIHQIYCWFTLQGWGVPTIKVILPNSIKCLNYNTEINL